MAATKKTTKKTATKKETVRVRALKALKKKDMTATEVREAIKLSHGLKPTLEQEVERGHLSNVPNPEGGDVLVYHLTAKGSKALKAGTVDPKRGE